MSYDEQPDGDPHGECAEEINRLKAELAAAKVERDLAIAHDRQPYPTADAYEKVCAARTKWQERAEKAEAERDALREDAERFRKLPDLLFGILWKPNTNLPALGHKTSGFNVEELRVWIDDAAIDKARGEDGTP